MIQSFSEFPVCLANKLLEQPFLRDFYCGVLSVCSHCPSLKLIQSTALAEGCGGLGNLGN